MLLTLDLAPSPKALRQGPPDADTADRRRGWPLQELPVAHGVSGAEKNRDIMQEAGDAPDGALPGLSSPNPENKLFVGGAPPGTDENTLQQVGSRRRPMHTASLPCSLFVVMPRLAAGRTPAGAPGASPAAQCNSTLAPRMKPPRGRAAPATPDRSGGLRLPPTCLRAEFARFPAHVTDLL